MGYPPFRTIEPSGIQKDLHSLGSDGKTDHIIEISYTSMQIYNTLKRICKPSARWAKKQKQNKTCFQNGQIDGTQAKKRERGHLVAHFKQEQTKTGFPNPSSSLVGIWSFEPGRFIHFYLLHLIAPSPGHRLTPATGVRTRDGETGCVYKSGVDAWQRERLFRGDGISITPWPDIRNQLF